MGLRDVVVSRDCQPENQLKKMRGKPFSAKAIYVLCIASFLAGSLFTNQNWTHPSRANDNRIAVIPHHVTKLQGVKQDCDPKRVSLVVHTLNTIT